MTQPDISGVSVAWSHVYKAVQRFAFLRTSLWFTLTVCAPSVLPAAIDDFADYLDFSAFFFYDELRQRWLFLYQVLPLLAQLLRVTVLVPVSRAAVLHGSILGCPIPKGPQEILLHLAYTLWSSYLMTAFMVLGDLAFAYFMLMDVLEIIADDIGVRDFIKQLSRGRLRFGNRRDTWQKSSGSLKKKKKKKEKKPHFL